MKKSIETKVKAPALLLLIVLVGFPQISETIFTPSLPDIALAFQTTMGSVQLTLSIYFFAFALGVFFWGLISDYIGRRPAILYGVVLYGVGSCLCLWADSIEFLLFARFVQAFGASTGSVVTQTILRESTTGNQRHALFAQISAALAFTPAIGPLIGGFVDQYWGFSAVFLVLVVMSIGVFGYAYFGLAETLDASSRSSVALRPIFKRFLKNKKVLTYGFLIGAINGVLFSYYAEAPFIFMEYFRLSAAIYGLLGVVIALALIIGSMLSKRWLAIWQPEKIIFKGIQIMLVGAVILLTLSFFNFIPGVIQFSCYLIGIFITLIGTGTALPNCLSLALVDFQDVIGSAGGIFSLYYYLLVSLITLGMSVLHNGTLWAMPLYFIGIGIFMLILTKRFIYLLKE